MCQRILYMLRLHVIPRINHKKNFAYKVVKVSATVTKVMHTDTHAIKFILNFNVHDFHFLLFISCVNTSTALVHKNEKNKESRVCYGILNPPTSCC